MSIMAKLKKNSKVSGTSVLSQSEFFNEKEITTIDVPMLNVALSGRVDGGLTSGLTVLAGPSKHFKTSFALKMAGAFLDANPEQLCCSMILNLVHPSHTLPTSVLTQIVYYTRL